MTDLELQLLLLISEVESNDVTGFEIEITACERKLHFAIRIGDGCLEVYFVDWWIPLSLLPGIDTCTVEGIVAKTRKFVPLRKGV